MTISDAGSTPAASTSLRPLRGLRLGRRIKIHQKHFVWEFTGEGCRAGALAQADLFMKYVYILQSLTGAHFYTGITDDLDARLSKHNSGAVIHTSKFNPWRIKSYVAFADEAAPSPSKYI
jgi:putative endonuclease